MLERELERYLVRRCKELDVLCYKFSSPNSVGVPDRILVHKGTVVFVELKALTGRLSAAQKRELGRLEEAGALALMLNTITGIDCLLENITCRTPLRFSPTKK